MDYLLIHWMNQKAVQYFHTIAFFLNYCCFILEALVKCQGISNSAASYSKIVVCKVVKVDVWTAGGKGGCKRRKGVAA